MRRVAVTGLGAISALGIGVEAMWEGMRRSECGIRPIENLSTECLKVRSAAQVPAFNFEPMHPSIRLQALDRTAQFALIAGMEAVTAAGEAVSNPHRAGVIFGASIGHETIDHAYKALYKDNIDRLHPLIVPRIMPNAPASHLSIAFGLRGGSYAVASACASSTHAIGLAFQTVRSGQLDVAVTGGSEAPLHVGVLKGWEALRVLSPDVCRPFSRDRNGLTLGEGAGVMVLEEMAHARARGATILGEIIGFGMTADAADLTAPAVDGAVWAMRNALQDAGLAPEAVGYINAHGTGTRLNDRNEARAIREVFGAHADRLAVSSTKAMLGHTMCATGALELVLTLRAMRGGLLPPTLNFREADPECDIDCVPCKPRPAAFDVALSNSFAFGGLNAVIAVRRAD